MAISLSDYAKEGLNRLKGGSPGICLNALDKNDLQYLLNYYSTKGFDAKEEKVISRDGVGINYPITVFHKMPLEVNHA